MKEPQIIKKNLKAKKGKKNWARNLDVSAIQHELEENQTKQFKQKNVKSQEKLSFLIDENQNQKIKKQLDKDRFRKKPNLIVSQKEEKQVRKIVKNFDQRNMQNIEEESEEDLWQTSNKPSKIMNVKEKPQDVAAVIVPHGGESYNPKFQDHMNLLQEVVDQEIKKDQKVQNRKPKSNQVVLKKQIKKPKSLNKRLIMQEEERQKLEKQQGHQFNMIKKYKKEILTGEQKSKQKQDEKIKKEIEIKELKKQGIVQTKKRYGPVVYRQPTKNFQLLEDVSSNLRTLKNNESIMRDQYDTIFRKNLLEIDDKNRRTKPKIKVRKYHNTDRDPKRHTEFD